MIAMFKNCLDLESLNLNFDTSKVINFQYIFTKYNELNEIKEIEKFNTNNVENMTAMF